LAAATGRTAVRLAFVATALFVGAMGSGGYALLRDLSFLYRTLFSLLLVLPGAGVVLNRRPRPGRVHDLDGDWGLGSPRYTRSASSTAFAGRETTRRSRSRPGSSSMS
jgi:hypothetical protein